MLYTKPVYKVFFLKDDIDYSKNAIEKRSLFCFDFSKGCLFDFYNIYKHNTCIINNIVNNLCCARTDIKASASYATTMREKGTWSYGKAPDCIASHVCVPSSNPADTSWVFQRKSIVFPSQRDYSSCSKLLSYWPKCSIRHRSNHVWR